MRIGGSFFGLPVEGDSRDAQNPEAITQAVGYFFFFAHVLGVCVRQDTGFGKTGRLLAFLLFVGATPIIRSCGFASQILL